MIWSRKKECCWRSSACHKDLELGAKKNMNKLVESTDHFIKYHGDYRRAIAVASRVDLHKTTKLKLIFLFLDFVYLNLVVYHFKMQILVLNNLRTHHSLFDNLI